MQIKTWFMGEVMVSRQKKSSRRVQITKTLYLVSAKSPEEAFRKFEIIGRANEGRSLLGDGFSYRFHGVSNLFPLYDGLIDGGEIGEVESVYVVRDQIDEYLKQNILSEKAIVIYLKRIEKRRVSIGYSPMFAGDVSSTEKEAAGSTLNK